MSKPSTGPSVGLDYTDEPVPLPPPNVPPPQDGTCDDDDMPGPSGYQDPVVPDETMPYDDPGVGPPDLGGTGGGLPGNQGGNDPDLPSDEIEFQYRPEGNPPPHYPGGGVSVPVPEDSSSMELIPDGAYGPSPDDDHPPYPMEVHTEPPLPGGPPDAPGAKQNSRLRIPTRSCNRHLTCHRPLLNRSFHFRIHIFRFEESCVHRHLGMSR